VLLIWGEQDDIFPIAHARAIRKRLTQAKLVTIPQCGHWSTIDAMEEIGNLIAEFLKRNPKR
jgi:pimeloyl-ACP methyl ester carboxylesterase